MHSLLTPEMSCSIRASDGCLTRFVRNIRMEALTKQHTNSYALALKKKKKKSSLTRRTEPYLESWRFMSSTNGLTPSPPAELGKGRRQSTCLHLYIKSTNQGVSVMHPSSWLTSWQLQCKSGSFIPMTLCQYLYGGDLTSLPFYS